jgi:hypothetical protein
MKAFRDPKGSVAASDAYFPIADGLEARDAGRPKEGPNHLRRYFSEGEERFPEVLLGARTAKSILQGRSKIRLLIPSEKSQPGGTSLP